MPMKAVGSTPFKGENFPQYLLYRSTRQCITTDVTSATQGQPMATPSVSTTPLTAAIKPESDRPPSRNLKARIPPNKRLRPSLSEQLKTISQGAQAITIQLTSMYNLPSHTNAPTLASSNSYHQPHLAHDKHSFQATTIGLSVGKLACRFPCPVTFTSDQCTYLFQHPFEAKEVLMVMYFRDMLHASVNMADHSFRFRLSRVLEQFGSDYNPNNTQHWIRITLATSSEAQKVKRFLAECGVTDRRRSSRTEKSCKSYK